MYSNILHAMMPVEHTAAQQLKEIPIEHYRYLRYYVLLCSHAHPVDLIGYG